MTSLGTPANITTSERSGVQGHWNRLHGVGASLSHQRPCDQTDTVAAEGVGTLQLLLATIITE